MLTLGGQGAFDLDFAISAFMEGGKSISNLRPENFPQPINFLCVRKFPIWPFVNSLSSIGLQMSQNGPEQCWRIACGNIYGIRRRLNTHMSAKHGGQSVN